MSQPCPDLAMAFAVEGAVGQDGADPHGSGAEGLLGVDFRRSAFGQKDTEADAAFPEAVGRKCAL